MFITVESTTLATVGYSQTRKVLQLEFGGGAIYQYFDVPAAVYQSLLRAGSKGAYFNQTIRGCFPYHRVSSLHVSAPDPPLAAGRQR